MKFVKLKDVCEIIMGQSPPSSSYNDLGEGLPFYQGKTDFGNLFPTPRKYCTEPKRIAKTNDIIMSVRAPVGDVNIIQEDSCIGRGVAALRVGESLEYKYLFYVLESMKNEISIKGTGSTFKAINKGVLSELCIPVFSREKQKEIVKIIEKNRELLEKRQQQIEALSALKQSIFLDMFGDPNINANNYETKRIDELCISIIGGGTPSKKNPEYYIGNIPWVTPKDMKREHINYTTDYINEEAIANSSAKLVPKNSLLIVIRSGILKHTLPVAINTKDVTINQDMKAFVIDESQVTTDYLFYYFKAMERSLLSKVRSVTAHNLNFNELKKMGAPIPDIHRQREFSRKINNINKSLEKINEQRINFELLFDSLIHKAFNGELFKEGMKV